jgi:hypothetical protein
MCSPLCQTPGFAKDLCKGECDCYRYYYMILEKKYINPTFSICCSNKASVRIGTIGETRWQESSEIFLHTFEWKMKPAGRLSEVL